MNSTRYGIIIINHNYYYFYSSGGSDSESRLSKLLLVATKGDSPGKKASPPLPHESLGPVLIELGKASLQYGCVSLAGQCVKMIETAKDKARD